MGRQLCCGLKARPSASTASCKAVVSRLWLKHPPYYEVLVVIVGDGVNSFRALAETRDLFKVHQTKRQLDVKKALGHMLTLASL